ncbi:hypothetical protein ATY81_20755 [Rhizobium sp. R72]|uniref:hypothetical protein n=1 Tax=Rhizobium sp. R693 TaxID=1764276 RepID=UPI000B538310|nr:hypothetical protein [Rhizobium sp. R693]OWV83451.1 hypothetical protein ATY79_12550 [Rhizobium sp. R693]OWW02986.1 hypothetical protein ATY81_20755 [Rhizobium sp. R72]OWW03168.1 hypothetical protein ATY80_20755 [Rhizobium sp. R711]
MNSGEKPCRVAGIAVGLLAMSLVPAWAGCKSAMSSPEWPAVERAISTAQLCEQLPVGPNRTSRFKVISADVCLTGDSLASIKATALLTCETGDNALFQMAPVEGKVVATVSLDVGACKITDTHIEIDGEIGSLLSELPDTQDVGRNWAQSQLQRLCQLR